MSTIKVACVKRSGPRDGSGRPQVAGSVGMSLQVKRDRAGGRVYAWPGVSLSPGGLVDTAIFDADSHLMETPDWLSGFAGSDLRERLEPLGLAGAGAGAAKLMASLPDLWESHRHQEIGPEVLTGPKGWMAPGALDTGVRSKVLDALGISAQLVFPTFALGHFAGSKDPDDPLRRHGGAQPRHGVVVRARPTAQAGGLPAPQRSRARSRRARGGARGGVAAVWVPSDAPGDFSPTHLDLDPVWSCLASARVPFVLHVGGGKLLPRAFHNNGLPRPKDWLGGGENLRSKDFPVLHHSPERFLACMALDGVFERHPDLRGAAIELGATWVPGLLRNVDHAHRSFSKFEPVLGGLAAQAIGVPAPPGPFHPVPLRGHGVVARAVRPDLFMFSTDYPHPEGGKRPFDVFERRGVDLRRLHP